MVESALLAERGHEPPRYGDRQACSASRYRVGRLIPPSPGRAGVGASGEHVCG
jgi:hypothetical protein